MGHPGHFILGAKCVFHLTTYVGGYIVSTVGELWNERAVREIHARIHNPKWLECNKHLLGDTFDQAYFEEFGFQEVGSNRLYETMVFIAEKSGNGRCPYVVKDFGEVDFESYDTADAATDGHYKMCEQYANL